VGGVGCSPCRVFFVVRLAHAPDSFLFGAFGSSRSGNSIFQSS